MARIMMPFFTSFASPKKAIAINENALVYLNAKEAQTLLAIAEAVVGPDFKEKVPDFISIIDDYLAYQRQASRDALAQGLRLIESRIMSLVFARRVRSFSYLSIEDRRKVLAHLKGSRIGLLRNLYAAFVNISASTYYSKEATWADIRYDGVSLDHPGILANPQWRPGDPRPVEP